MSEGKVDAGRKPCRTCDLGYDDDPNEVCTCSDPDPAPRETKVGEDEIDRFLRRGRRAGLLKYDPAGGWTLKASVRG